MTSVPTSGAATTRGSWEPPTGARSRLVLVRHGSTVHSGAHRMSGRNELPLTDEGRAQAAALAAALAAREHGDIDALISSPATRALQTAEPIAAALDLDVEVVPEFAELDFGEWEGLTGAQLRERDPAVAAEWSAGADVSPPGGESFADVARRVRRGRDLLLQRPVGSIVVVVTHVTPIKTLVRLALDAPVSAMFALFLDIASVTVVESTGAGNTSVRLVNDTAHLRHRAG